MPLGLEQGAVAEGGAGEEGVGAALALSQCIFQRRQELVGPGYASCRGILS